MPGFGWDGAHMGPARRSELSDIYSSVVNYPALEWALPATNPLCTGCSKATLCRNISLPELEQKPLLVFELSRTKRKTCVTP